jgi:hypothetical protein
MAAVLAFAKTSLNDEKVKPELQASAHSEACTPTQHRWHTLIHQLVQILSDTSTKFLKRNHAEILHGPG